MKLNIERSSRLKSLQHIQGVVERRTTIPILSNVLLRAADSSLAMTATDLDLAIVEKAPGEVTQDGATTVPAHTLFDIVRKRPEGAQVEIASGGAENRLEVKCGRSRLIPAWVRASSTRLEWTRPPNASMFFLMFSG